MSTRIPKAVKIGCHIYKVVVGGEAWKDALIACGIEDGHDLFGHTMHKTSTISIRPGLAPLMQKETLLHEIMHGIAAATGNVLDSLLNEEGEREENVCSLFAPALLAVMRENAALVRYLTEPVV